MVEVFLDADNKTVTDPRKCLGSVGEVVISLQGERGGGRERGGERDDYRVVSESMYNNVVELYTKNCSAGI